MKSLFITALFLSLSFTLYAAYAAHFAKKLCNTTGYTCYITKRGDTWHKLFADEDQRDLVMRINRMNTKLYPGLKLAIPESDDPDPLNYSPFPKSIDASGKKTIVVSKANLAFAAYSENGDLLYWGPISAAKGYCPDVHRRCTTPSGNFKVLYKQGPGCVSSKYPVGRGGAPMPYCMFFHGGYALHGSYDVPGYHASHGCIRLFVKDAQWLNQEFMGDSSRPKVIVY